MSDVVVKGLDLACGVCGALLTPCGAIDEEGLVKLDCRACMLTSEVNGMDQDMQTMRRTHEREMWQLYQQIALIESMLRVDSPAEDRVTAVQVYLATAKGPV
jgi:hypothetical protein